jgi:hypothetical protein
MLTKRGKVRLSSGYASAKPILSPLVFIFLPTAKVEYFVDRLSSGFVEGLDNKIKTIKRRCYGITRIVTLFQRLYLDLEGYRRFA